MNKNELITFLRNPNDLTESDLGELEEIIKSNPYFLNGRLLLAKGSKELKHPETRKRISSAAVYSTDRPLFKKYLSDKLFFLSQPPEEELETESAKEVKSVKPKQENREQPTEQLSKKIEIIDTPKEDVKENKSKEKSRREPRFDPSATASFKRRWDVKSDSSDSTPRSSESEPANKPIFAGKKIDRSNRVKKKSIREELLNDDSPKKKVARPELKSNLEVKKATEQRAALAKAKEESKKDLSKSAPEPRRKALDPLQKKSENTIPSAKTKPSVESKKVPSATPDSKQESKVNKRINRTKSSEGAKESVSFFDDIKKTSPQKKSGEFASEAQSTRKQVQTSPKKEHKEEHTPVVIRTTSKQSLNIPEVPSGGIDAILEELQRDMEMLKSSRIKFTEVQQKIEEDDAVTAAVERATSRIPKSTLEPEPLVEEIETEEIPAIKESRKNEKVAEVTSGEEKQEVKEKKSTIKSKEEKPKPKKATSTKKKISVKETTSKKAAPKKTPAKKGASKTTKAKSAKTKTNKKEEKKDDNKTGKQKANQSTIIDKFIAETPSIKYQKKVEPSDNTDLSDQSTEWNKELASEYLAEIYLHQGNKKRAIEIYTVLSLKFPNKKSYFADLISKTK